MLHRGSAGSGSFKAGFRSYNICCFSSVPGRIACGGCVCRLETPLSVSIWMALSGSGVFLLDSHLPVWSSEPLLYSYFVKILWFHSYSVKKLWFLSYWHLPWMCLAEVIACAVLEGSQEGQASLGLKGKGRFHFPSFFLSWVSFEREEGAALCPPHSDSLH